MSTELDMIYNSSRDDLIIPEYGRHVQNLINYATTIEDPEYRQAFVEKIIDLMQQMHPQNRNMDDYREKLWKHVFRISEYKLDVVPPSGEKPSAADAKKKPEMIPYPSADARYRHYGHNVQRMIQKAVEMEEGPVRDGFVAAIGSYMKLAYKTWNRDLYVSDEIIKGDLETISEGKLKLPDETNIENLTQTNRRRRRPDSGGNNDRSDRSDRSDRRSRARTRRSKR